MSKALIINEQVFNQDWVGRICLELVSGEYFLVIHSKHNDSLTQVFKLRHWKDKTEEAIRRDWDSFKSFLGTFFGKQGIKLIIVDENIHMSIYN